MKKTVSLFLSLVIFISMFSFCTEAFAECEHDYKLNYSFNSEKVEIVATPKCSKCGTVDTANILILSGFSFNGTALTVKVNNPANPYISQLPVPSKYLTNDTFSVPVTELMDLIPEFGKLLSPEDKKALAEKFGVDEKVFTCSHKNIADIKNFDFKFNDDFKTGSVTITCPDCGLSLGFHFTVTAFNSETKEVTVRIDELNKSFTFNIGDLIEKIMPSVSEGESINPEEMAKYIEMVSALTGGKGFDVSSATPGGYSGYSVKKPKGTKIIKKKGLKKAIKIKWKKIKGIKGYQIRYATSKKALKNKKKAIKKTIKGAKKTSFKIKKLKKKKTYYIQIRTYKVVNKKKVYSKWSKAVKVKTK